MSLTRIAPALAALALLAALPAAADTQKKAPASAQSEAAQKKADIKRYFQLSACVDHQVLSYRHGIADMKKGSSREIPDTFWSDLSRTITIEAFEPVMADVYDRGYSPQELRDVLKLVDVPAFRKFSQIEQTAVQKAVGTALQKHMEDAPAAGQQPSAPGPAIAAQKKADIRRFLKLTESVNRQVEGARLSLEAQKKSGSKDVPDTVWADLAKAATPEAFEAVMLGVYDKSYTAQEIHAILQIVDNPTFKSFTYKEQNTVQKDLGAALDRFMSDASKRLMPKHQAAAKKG